jgi:putative Mg2+ transporter-C (MgtC) family protein
MVAATIPTLSWAEALLRLSLAAILSGLIGIEREYREREAGLRTHMLVAVGSALFTLVSAYGFHDFIAAGGNVVRTDPSRIAAQIVTGVGFLGAGAIIRQGLAVRGLTTAATLWVCAAIGLAAGTGYYSAAVITTGVTLVLLWPLRFVARRMFSHQHVHKLEVKVGGDTSAASVVDALEQLGVRVASFELGEDDLLHLQLDLPRSVLRQAVVRRLVAVPGVRSAVWPED